MHMHMHLTTQHMLPFLCAGDAWDAFLLDTSCQPPNCDAAAGQCGTPLASTFFLPFMLLCSFLLLSILVAVVIEAFKMTRDPPQVSWGSSQPGHACRASAQLPALAMAACKLSAHRALVQAQLVGLLSTANPTLQPCLVGCECR